MNSYYSKNTDDSININAKNCLFHNYNPRKIFKVHEEPNNNGNGNNIILNSSLLSNKYDKSFIEIDKNKSLCGTTTFINSDPRLYNAASDNWLQLDIPPIDYSKKIDNINEDETLNSYGQKYQSYTDINSGNILYYIGKDTEDSFYEPVFSTKATTLGYLYKDPMGSIKPQYDRVYKEKIYDPPRLGHDFNQSGDFCLSFIKDSHFHREDLLSRQMSKRNQEKFSSRWYNINKIS